MNKRGHKIGGLVATSITLAALEPGVIEGALLTSGIILGAFLPDIDADYSYFNSKFKIISKAYKLIPNDNIVFRHRGLLFHSIYTVLLLVLLYRNNGCPWILGLIIGIVSHHILDLTTSAGLPNYFYPITKKSHH